MKTIYLAAIAALIASQALAEEQAGFTTFTMQPGMVQMADMPAAFAKVVVGGDDKIVYVTAMTDRRIGVTAKKEGFASILLLAADHKAVGQVVVKVLPPEQFGRSEVRVIRFVS